jgi:hypothetical protein
MSSRKIYRRDGRVVEGARLESVYTVKGIKGSNPFLSANLNNFTKIKRCLICNNSNLIKLGKIKTINLKLNNCFNFIECANCFHCTLDYMPKQNFLDRLYSNDSEYVFGHSDYELLIKKKFQKNRLKSVSLNFNHWVFKIMKNFKKGDYFEIGPGNCSLFKTFKHLGYKCFAYEKQSWILDNNIFHKINDIPRKKADLVVMTDVLEHISNPLNFLKKFNFVFKKNTRLFLSLPNRSSYKAKLLSLEWNMIVPLAHINFFSTKSMKIFLNKMNFNIIKIESYSEVKIYRLLRNFIKFLFKIPIYLFLMRFSLIKDKICEFLINIIDLLKGDQMRVVAIKK